VRNLLPTLLAAALFLGSSFAQNAPPAATSSQQGAPSEGFSDRTLNNVLNEIKKGMEAHDAQAVLSSFDSGKMEGYLDFASQFELFLSEYDSFRLHYRIVQTDVEGQKGIALVEMQMQADPHDPGAIPLRRDRQVRFELEPSKKDWKVVGINPRAFFAP
jgi:hypothetical protein